MTKAELITELQETAAYGKRTGDAETAHKQADTALLDYINDQEITVAFDAVRKWYR